MPAEYIKSFPKLSVLEQVHNALKRSGEFGMTSTQIGRLVGKTAKNVSKVLMDHPDVFEIVPGKHGEASVNNRIWRNKP